MCFNPYLRTEQYFLVSSYNSFCMEHHLRPSSLSSPRSVLAETMGLLPVIAHFTVIGTYWETSIYTLSQDPLTIHFQRELCIQHSGRMWTHGHTAKKYIEVFIHRTDTLIDRQVERDQLLFRITFESRWHGFSVHPSCLRWSAQQRRDPMRPNRIHHDLL